MDSTTNLTPEQKIHVNVMLSIARSLSDTPMVLKGGTALLLAYQLDRFSEDLDFDSDKKIHLENRIFNAASKHAKVKRIDILKNTPTVSRYRLLYETSHGTARLKIETSFRSIPTESQMINGIKVYPIETLIKQKLNAFENRTRARDLYDINFLAKKFPDKFTNTELSILLNSLSNLDGLEKRFLADFIEDNILHEEDVTKIVVSLQESAQKIQQTISDLQERKNDVSEHKKFNDILKEYIEKKVELSRLTHKKILNMGTDSEAAKRFAEQSVALMGEIKKFSQNAMQNSEIIGFVERMKTSPIPIVSIGKHGGFEDIEKRFKATGHLSEEEKKTLIISLKSDANSLAQTQQLTQGRGGQKR
jgi:hypothetical protein